MGILWINLLRVVHVFGAALWVGAAVLYLFYIGPSVKATAPGGMQFLQYFIARKKYPQYMGIIATLTVLSGAVLYWRDFGGSLSTVLSSGFGLGITIGTVASIIVYILGMVAISPRGERLGVLGGQIQASGGPPTPEQVAEMQKLEKELHTLEWVDFILLAIAMVTMATARYWLF